MKHGKSLGTRRYRYLNRLLQPGTIPRSFRFQPLHRLYSITTKKELLTKPGLRDSEREFILVELSRCRPILLSDSIAARYCDLRRLHPSLDKGDALIAATALVKRLPLMTRNKRHFQMITGLTLFGE